MFSTRRVGGIRFFRLWRFRISFCIASRARRDSCRSNKTSLKRLSYNRITGIPYIATRAPE